MITLDDIAALYAVPPHLLGKRAVPGSREEAAREALVYYRAFGTEPPRGADPDIDAVLLADQLWGLGLVDEARELLRPLQERRCG